MEISTRRRWKLRSTTWWSATKSCAPRFVAPDGELRQRIVASAPVTVPTHDLRGHPDPEGTERTLLRDWLQRPFDLARDPLLRLGVVQRADHRYRLLLVQHHIITDGRSTALFLDDLIDTYRARLNGAPAPREKSRLQYADYAAWHRQWLESAAARRQLDHWRHALGADSEPIDVPTDLPRSAQRPQGARLHLQVPPDVAQALQSLARAHNTTVFAPLLTAWMLLLHRYAGREAMRVGIPIAGRGRPETETMLGCFVNLVTIQARLSPHLSFEQVLQQVSARSVEAQRHQDVPFETIVQALSAGRDLNRHPLFQVVFNHQHHDAEALANWPGAAVTVFDPGSAGAQFDLALDTEAAADGSIRGYVSYNRTLFRQTTIENLAGHYLRLLETVLASPDRPIATIALPGAEERQRLDAWNDTTLPRGPFVPIPARQSRQAMRTPDAVALSDGEQALTYAELDHRVNRLAHRLVRAGVGPEARVAVCLHRSIDLVLALLAIVRAGGAYVPLDPGYPPERMRMILDEAAPVLAFSEVPLDGVYCWHVNDPASAADPVTPPDVSWHPDQAMYVIYTSGSTGRPKGVINTHGALENRLLWMQEQYPLGEGDCVLQKTPFGFDVSVWEFFWPFMTGARLAVAPPDAHGDPRALRAVMDAECVTTVHFVPSMLQATLPELAGCPSLTRIICSGEALSADLQRQTLTALPDVGLFNLYGPTEAAIDVSHWHCRDDGRVAVPIGAPISNLRLHVLDPCLNPVPVGMPGELYLAGIGLARGYLGRADLTGDRFLPDPFGLPGSRMYRTGDAVRRGEDGVLDYLGRLDHQIKIRGLRIEPGEVETMLRRQEAVADALVVAHGDLLTAYVHPGDGPGRWLAGCAQSRPGRAPPGLHGADAVRRAGGLSPVAERQAGPQGPAAPRSAPPQLSSIAHAGATRFGGCLAGGPGLRRDRPGRQLL